LTVRLTGDPALSTADLSNFSAKASVPAGETQLTFRPEQNSKAEPGSRTLVADFSAPRVAGAYIVRVEIPGIDEAYTDVFIVSDN
jgi:hypothetical protein